MRDWEIMMRFGLQTRIFFLVRSSKPVFSFLAILFFVENENEKLLII